MVSMQAHTGYFPLVNLRLKIKLTYNQSTKATNKKHYFLNSQFCHVVSTIFKGRKIVCNYFEVWLYTTTIHSKTEKNQSFNYGYQEMFDNFSFTHYY